MTSRARVAFVFVASALLLTTCFGTATSVSLPAALRAVVTPTIAPTLTPTIAPPTPSLDVQREGIWPISANALPPELRSLSLGAGSTTFTLAGEAIRLYLPGEALLAQVSASSSERSVVRQVVYDHELLRSVLERLAQEVDQPAQVQVREADDGGVRRFVLVPGVHLDLDAAQTRMDTWLHGPLGTEPITFSLAPVTSPVTLAPPAQLQHEIETLAQGWDGVAGVYVEDLTHTQSVAGVNQDTVFSGASVLKIAILLQAYLALPTFSDEQEQWMEQMIVDSSNVAADQLLAAIAGGENSNDAARGAQQLTAMLQSLGLQHTYLSTPYEDDNYVVDFTGIAVAPGPDDEGTPPFTVADQFARATPAEIGRLLSWIDACSRGAGPLLEHFPDKLNAARCGEMIARLERNGDHTRMMAGLPDNIPVAHKSGWISDTQADVGIVYSPGGIFLLAVYLYRDGNSSTAGQEGPTIASVARLVYSYFNPELVITGR